MEKPKLSGNDLPELSDASLDWSRTGTDFDRDALFEGVSWRRVVAFFIDLAILGVVLAGLWILAFLTLGLLSGLLTLTPLLPIAYHTLMIASRRSATIGMQFMGVEVRNQSGKRPELLQAFAMTALFYFSVALTSTLILIVALFNDRRRCAHDILSGTIVINTDPDL
jgi:uncharacterized RDD family membrane protein YckC